METLWGPSGNLLVGALWEHSGKFLGAFWDPSGCLLATKACLGSLLGACLGLCLGPGWGHPGSGGAFWGQITWLGPAALGPAQGPLRLPTPAGEQRTSKTLGFRVFTFVCCLHQVWLFVALPWQGWKRPSFTWAYA